MVNFRSLLRVAGSVVLLGAAVGLATAPAMAQYPDRPVRSIVPFAPGGASDLLARLFAQGLTDKFKQSFYIENKPGAGGNIGMEIVTDADPDGYTILFSSIATTQNPALFTTMPFDPLTDLVPVAKIGESAFVIAVNSDRMPVNSVQEFVDLVRANPGKYNAAAGGLVTQLTVEMFRLQNDLQVTVIPYSSAGVAANALMSGETDFMIVDAAPLLPGIAAGKVKVLAITSAERSPELPDVPTTVEAGFPDFHETTYFGAYVPKGTPDDVITTLNTTLNEIAGSPEIGSRLEALGWTPTQESVAEFQAFYLAEIAKWKKLVMDAHIPMAN